MYTVKLNNGTSFQTKGDVGEMFKSNAKMASSAEFFVIPDTDGYNHYIPKHSLVEIVELSSC